MRAQLFVTCLVNELYPGVAESAVKVLGKLGVDLDIPPSQVCCGQPAFNAGCQGDARAVGLATLRAFENGEGPLIVPSGSCADMLSHHLPTLFEQGSPSKALADRVAARVREFSQFLVDDLHVGDLGGKLDADISYHPSCHLLRGLGIKGRAEALLKAVKGTRLLPFEDSEECCGFGGSFSVTHHELSASMMADKLAKATKPGPSRLVSCDMGCLMHLEGGLKRQGRELKVQHLAEYLAESLS